MITSREVENKTPSREKEVEKARKERVRPSMRKSQRARGGGVGERAEEPDLSYENL